MKRQKWVFLPLIWLNDCVACFLYVSLIYINIMTARRVRPSSASEQRERHRYYDYEDNEIAVDHIRMTRQRDLSTPRNVLEAQVQDGDTLQAIAIRYNCSVIWAFSVCSLGLFFKFECA